MLALTIAEIKNEKQLSTLKRIEASIFTCSLPTLLYLEASH